MLKVEMGSLMAMIYLNKTDCNSGSWRDTVEGGTEK